MRAKAPELRPPDGRGAGRRKGAEEWFCGKVEKILKKQLDNICSGGLNARSFHIGAGRREGAELVWCGEAILKKNRKKDKKEA